MSNDVVNNQEGTAAYVCPSAHVFFLRERDVVAVLCENSGPSLILKGQFHEIKEFGTKRYPRSRSRPTA
jgi:hypothetical protein